jgi:dimeric dUTPase (all-alpha-NTP-PPase superfamily)
LLKSITLTLLVLPSATKRNFSSGDNTKASGQDIFKSMINFFECAEVNTFFTLIIGLCQFTKKPLSLKEVWEGYFEKNKLNFERVEGGYMKGEYQKINENGEEDNRRIKFED